MNLVEAVHVGCRPSIIMWYNNGMYLTDVADKECKDGLVRTVLDFLIDRRDRSDAEIEDMVKSAKIAFIVSTSSVGLPLHDVKFRYKVARDDKEIEGEIARQYMYAMSIIGGSLK